MNAARVLRPAPVIAPIRSARGTHQSCPASSRRNGNPAPHAARNWCCAGMRIGIPASRRRTEGLGPRFRTVFLVPCLTELVSAVFRPIP